MNPSPMRRRLTLLVVVTLVVPILLAVWPPAAVHGQGGDVVISQVYAGGQSGTAPIRSDYIELFNPGTDPVPVDGWSVQYASRDGTTWRRALLTGTIPPGGFYLVQGVSGEAGAELPTPDATGGLALAAGNGRLALVRTTGPLTCGADPGCATGPDVVDFVGYGPGTVSFAGSGPAPSPGRDGALVLAVDGCGDTDDNATDYQIDLPAPRTSAAPPDPCSGTGPVGPTPPAGSVRIRDIQGRSHLSPLEGDTVVEVPGVVTGVGGTFFWMQDPAAGCRRGDLGGDPRLSECPTRRAPGRCGAGQWPRRRGAPGQRPAEPDPHRDPRPDRDGGRAQPARGHHAGGARSGRADAPHRGDRGRCHRECGAARGGL